MDNHGAVDPDMFVNFFQQAQSLDMALAFEQDVSNSDGSARKLAGSFKKAVHVADAAMFTASAARQDRELKISHMIGQVYKNEVGLQVLTMTGQKQ